MLRKGFCLFVSVLTLLAVSSGYAFSAAPTLGTLTPTVSALPVDEWRTITCTYSDADGMENLSLCSLLINNAISNVGAAHFVYSQNTNKFYMKNESGTLIPSTGVIRGSATIIESPNAYLDCRATTVSFTSTSITIAWRFKLKSTMAKKTCSIYAKADDDTSLSTGWVAKLTGVYIDSPPAVGSVTPSSGLYPVDTWQTFTCTYSDADGAANLWLVNLLINNGISNSGACHVVYSQNTNKFFMKNNAGTLVPANGVVRGTDAVIETESAILDCKNSTVTTSGNTITVGWRVKFKAPMTGKTCNLYLQASDDYEVVQPWLSKGTAFVNAPPTLGPVSPATGESKTDEWKTFSCTYVDPNGATNLGLCSMLVNNTISNTGACHVVYSQNTNKFYMKNAAGTLVPEGGVVRGTVQTIETESAILDCGGSTVAISGNTITVNWRVKFKSNMAGKSCQIYTRAEDDFAQVAGWISKGTTAITTSDFANLIAAAKQKLNQIIAMEPFDENAAATLMQQAKSSFQQALTLRPNSPEANFGVALTTAALTAQNLISKYKSVLSAGDPAIVSSLRNVSNNLWLLDLNRTVQPENNLFSTGIRNYLAMTPTIPTPLSERDRLLMLEMQNDIRTVVIPTLANVAARLDIVEQDPYFTFEIAPGDPADRKLIDIGDIYIFHGMIMLAKALLAIPASYSIDPGTWPVIDVELYDMDANHDGYLTRSEWLPPSPFMTLMDPTLMYAQRGDVLIACEKALAGIDATLRETYDDAELIPMHGVDSMYYRGALAVMRQMVEDIKRSLNQPTVMQIPWDGSVYPLSVYLGAWSDNPPPDLTYFMPRYQFVANGDGVPDMIWSNLSMRPVEGSYPDTTFGGLFPEGLPNDVLYGEGMEVDPDWLVNVTTDPADHATGVSKTRTQFSVTWLGLGLYPIYVELYRATGTYTWTAVSITPASVSGTTATYNINTALLPNTWYRIKVNSNIPWYGWKKAITHFRTGP